MMLGILSDVSGSMKENLQFDQYQPSDENVSRGHTIFTSLINATREESQIKDDQKVFAIAFGLDLKRFQICDLIALLEYLKKRKEESNSNAAGDSNEVVYLSSLISRV